MNEQAHSAASVPSIQNESMAEAITDERSLLGLPAWMWALLGLVIGFAATAFMILLERHNLQVEAALQFSQVARRTVQQIERRLETSGLLLRAVQSAFLTDSNFSGQRFLNLHDNLRPDQHLPSAVATAFGRKSRNAEGTLHYRYEWVAPIERNESLIGFDMSSQPENLRTLERARDTDLPVMSAPFRLVQPPTDPRDEMGVVVRLPVYSSGPIVRTLEERRAREIGALGISMRLRPLLLAALPEDALNRFRVYVYDVTGGGRILLFNSATDSPPHGMYEADMHFGERHWRLELEPRELGYDVTLLWLLAAGGLFASLLLAGLLWSVAVTRQRAVAIGREMSARYRESEQRFRTLNDLLPALVLTARAEDRQIVYGNHAAIARLGDSLEGVDLASFFEDPELRRRLSVPDEHVPWSSVEAALRSRNGSRFWASVSIARVKVGHVDRLLMIAGDISEQRKLTDLLSYQASHDSLTELFNRREFERHLQRLLRALGDGGPAGALLYIDLDQFKIINDTSGHLAGDQLLSQLAMAMNDQLRPGDVLARLGGDEFGVLVHSVDRDNAHQLAERLRVRIEAYVFVWEQRSYMISASIGVVQLDRPGQTIREVLSHADSACYMAKDHGRNRIHFFSDQDDETIRRRGEMEWVHRLRWVIDEERLLLDYQDVVPLQREPGSAPHIELLIRLRDEKGDIVLPGAFLPAAERYGMVPLLDRWVIAQAIEHFDELHASGQPLARCSLNLSASTLEDDGLAEYVVELIERYGVEPSRLCFEITETEAVRNFARAVRFIERLRAFGCLVALDDFGAGMSSFGYLKNLPVDVIKIDGSFIRDLDGDPMNRSIVEVITEIGHQRSLDVIAEWVSTESAVATLRELHVDYAQGYALHRPERVLYQRTKATATPVTQ